MAKKSRFVNRARNRKVETIVKASKASSSSFDNWLTGEVTYFKPRDGENNIRILPPTWDDMDKWGDNWAITIDIHYNVGSDNGSYLCLEKMKGEPCPVCEARNASSDEEERNQLRPNRRALCYVLDRDNEKAGPQVWAMPLTLYREINTRSIDKDTNTPILIDDPEEGYDVTFIKEGSGARSKYAGVDIARKATPLSDSEKKAERWLNTIEEHALPELLQYYEHDHIERVLSGGSSRKSDDDEDEDDDRPRRRRRRGEDDEETAKADERAMRANKKRVDPDDDDDDDDEEEEVPFDPDEDEDDEDEKPARGKRASKSKRDDDDDDDDDDDEDEDEENEDEDEDEDEKPARRRRGSKSDDDDEDDEDDDDDDEEDDDEDDDDDDEDEKPKKGKGREVASSRARAKLEKLKNKRGKK